MTLTASIQSHPHSEPEGCVAGRPAPGADGVRLDALADVLGQGTTSRPVQPVIFRSEINSLADLGGITCLG